ncbi:MAG: hypothetical protein M1839_005515 [Geoglossum umbratile]|nr:MAG: hypothetical protein M1839_005515 [Geoglossum umbratile]
MAINYIPNDEVFSSWQPHLDEQNMDRFLKACEFEEPFPDVFDQPPYQTLDEIFPVNSDTGIYTGDLETRTQAEEEIDIEEIFMMDEYLRTGDGEQGEIGIGETRPEVETTGTLKMDPLNNEPPTRENGENTTGDTMLNSTLSQDRTLEAGTPSSGDAYCCCCNEVSNMKRQVRNILIADFRSDIRKILFELGMMGVAVDNIQRGLHSFSYDVNLVIESAQQWMAENGAGSIDEATD